ncbi:SprT-like domain-containing protein [Cytobacillus oceanisediminis]|uniref:SprT-like domain-containing protein n=1 Tax=Cytobacillus oceanisediminis TaxID=665099 RepID=UPI002040D790|nr:SprT-like domain-containing protein [Cytobacillus oceanisediminis]MCM3405502.1 SprT-like domain-containing protein [Cytobacillus oceanisediminis]
MNKKPITIEIITSELHKAYDIINKHFFESKLPVIAITIQSDARRKLTMGWCTTKEVWGDKEGKIKMYEINLTPEFLDLNFYETMDTLMHEMVHLFNKINNVQDVSRNGTYHNKHFKNESIKRGFCYKEDKPDKKYGWSFSRLSEETKKKLDNLGINKDIFSIARRTNDYYVNIEMGNDPEQETEQKKKGNSYKWVCPCCNTIVRSTKVEVNIICGDCNEEFQLEDY